MPLQTMSLHQRLIISAVAVFVLTLFLVVATEGSGKSAAGLLILGIAFVGGFIVGSYWAIPISIVSIYAASALHNDGLNFPDPRDPSGDLFVISLLLFLTLLSGVIAAGVVVSKPLRR